MALYFCSYSGVRVWCLMDTIGKIGSIYMKLLWNEKSSKKCDKIFRMQPLYNSVIYLVKCRHGKNQQVVNSTYRNPGPRSVLTSKSADISWISYTFWQMSAGQNEQVSIVPILIKTMKYLGETVTTVLVLHAGEFGNWRTSGFNGVDNLLTFCIRKM